MNPFRIMQYGFRITKNAFRIIRWVLRITKNGFRIIKVVTPLDTEKSKQRTEDKTSVTEGSH